MYNFSNLTFNGSIVDRSDIRHQNDRECFNTLCLFSYRLRIKMPQCVRKTKVCAFCGLGIALLFVFARIKMPRCVRKTKVRAFCGLGIALLFVFAHAMYHEKYLADQFSTLTGFRIFTEYSEPDRKLLESKWIHHFPHLVKLVKSVNQSRPVGLKMTNPSQTSIFLINDQKDYKVGDELRAKIIAKNGLGERKKYGGDFFTVILRRPKKDKDGVVCQVFDKTDGSYDVTCVLPWTGKAVLSAILINPSETILQQMRIYSFEKEYGYEMKTTMLTTSNRKVFTTCAAGYPDKRSDELCDFSNRKYGQPYKCIKPSSENCLEILWQEPHTGMLMVVWFWLKNHFQKNNVAVPINGSKLIEIDISSSDGSSGYFDRSLFDVDPDPMKPTGWIFDSTWKSFKINLKPYSQERLKNCAKNKIMYFLGDSTIRQWYTQFKDAFGLKDNYVEGSLWSQSRDCFEKDLNASFHFRAHGPPLRNHGPPSVRPYITDTLDAITEGGDGTVIIITIGYHFEAFGADVYLERLRITRKVIEALLARLPGVKVFIKGINYYFGPPNPSPWLTYRLDVIMRHEWADIKGLIFFETWDYTLLMGNLHLHPPASLVRDQIGFAMSYFC